MLRIETSEAYRFLIGQLNQAQSVKEIHHDSGDIIEIRLRTGVMVSIYLVERFIDTDYLTLTFAENAKTSMYSLFILWEEMLLPAHNSWFKPNDWMLLLQAIHGGKIYGYRPNGNIHSSIFPVYFEHVLDAETKCFVRFGKRVDFERLVSRSAQTYTPQHGHWLIADFDGEAIAPTPPIIETAPPPAPTRPIPDGRLPLKAHFQRLGVALDTDADTIRNAYRDLARRLHPDLNQSPVAHEAMQYINESYRLIVKQLKTE